MITIENSLTRFFQKSPFFGVNRIWIVGCAGAWSENENKKVGSLATPLLSIVKEPNNIRLKNRLKKIPQYWAIIFTLDQGSIFKIGIVGLGKDPLEMFQRLSELFPPLFLSNYWFITQIIENSGRDVITPPLKFPSWKLELREQAILHWHCH